MNNGGYIIEQYNQQSPRNFSCSAWNKLNREMSPKKTPPRAHVIFDEVELNSIQIQGDTKLTKGSVLTVVYLTDLKSVSNQIQGRIPSTFAMQ